MKKLILVPTILVTAFLAVAFLMPGTAAGALRAVPGLNAVVTSAVSAAGGSGLVSAISGSRLTQGSGQSAQAPLYWLGYSTCTPSVSQPPVEPPVITRAHG